MVIMLHSFNNNKYWLIDGGLISSTVGLLIRKGSKYNQYLTHENDILNSLLQFYKTKPLFDENTILGQLNKTTLVEHNHRQKRENLLEQYFTFEYPKTDGMIYDLKINNYKIQDKSDCKRKTKEFQFRIKHVSGKKWYEKSDNDYYWLYNTTNSKFLVIPTFELVKLNIIKDNNIKNQELKSSFMINFDNCKEHPLKNYVFDYDNLDIPKLLNLFKVPKLQINYFTILNQVNKTNQETQNITNKYRDIIQNA